MAAHLAILRNSYGGNIRTTTYVCRQFVPNARMTKTLILGGSLYNVNAMHFKLNMSEPCATFVSHKRCASRI